jgi:hypothetical protein
VEQFSIRFTGEVRERYDEDYALGIIRIAEFEETFWSSLSYWSTANYEQSWQASLQRIAGGADPSCLITDFHDPQWANFITTWPIYRVNEKLSFQNQLIFLDQLTSPFVTERPWESVDEYESVDEDGNKISEWFVPVSAIQDFLRST